MGENFLSKTVGLISISGVLVLSASVVYDYGYFFAFDVDIAEMPTTLSDHLRSSLNWIPYTVALFFGVFIYEMFIRRIEQGKTKKELIQSSPAPQFTAWSWDLHEYFIIFAAFSVPILYFMFDIDVFIQAFQLSSIIIWVLLHKFLYGHERIMRRSSKSVRMLSFLVPPILIFIFFQGGVAADKIKRGEGNRYVFLTEKDKTTSVLVRTFDKHYMLWDEDKGKIRLLSMNTVIEYYPEDTKENPTKKRDLREEVKKLVNRLKDF